MSSEAKPYTKEEAAELGTSHYGASAARVRATVAELESAGREIERLKSYLGNFLGLDEMEKLRKSNAVLRESVIALNVLFEGVAEAAKYVGEKEPEELWSHIEDVVAERDSLRAEMERMKLDEQMLSDDDDACHRLLDAALGEGSLATTSMETLLERLPRLIDERDSLRSQRDAARKELGDVLENLDLKSLNSALDEVRAQASEFSLALALEKVARAKAELERDALAEALETLRLVVGPESEDEMYGAFHGGDPRDFTPDPECSTEAERSAHAVACKKAEESGAARLLPDTHSFERLGEDAAVHIARAGFGLGTTVFRNEALCEAMDIIGAALLRVKP